MDNTEELHYVKVPKNHIIIDFDIKNADWNEAPTGIHLTCMAETLISLIRN